MNPIELFKNQTFKFASYVRGMKHSHRKVGLRNTGRRKYVVDNTQENVIQQFKGIMGYQISQISAKEITLDFHVKEEIVFSNIMTVVKIAFDGGKFMYSLEVVKGESVLFSKTQSDATPWKLLQPSNLRVKAFEFSAGLSPGELHESKQPHEFLIMNNSPIITDNAGSTTITTLLNSYVPVNSIDKSMDMCLYSKWNKYQYGEEVPSSCEMTKVPLTVVCSDIKQVVEELINLISRVLYIPHHASLDESINIKYIRALLIQLEAVWNDIIASVPSSILAEQLSEACDHEIIYSDNSVRIMKSMDIFTRLEEWMRTVVSKHISGEPEETAEQNRKLIQSLMWSLKNSIGAIFISGELQVLIEVVLCDPRLFPFALKRLQARMDGIRQEAVHHQNELMEYHPHHKIYVIRRSKNFITDVVLRIPEVILKKINPPRKTISRVTGIQRSMSARRSWSFADHIVYLLEDALEVRSSDNPSTVLRVYQIDRKLPIFFASQFNCVFAYFLYDTSLGKSSFCRLDLKELERSKIPEPVPISTIKSSSIVLSVSEEESRVSIIFYDECTIRFLWYTPLEVGEGKHCSKPQCIDLQDCSALNCLDSSASSDIIRNALQTNFKFTCRTVSKAIIILQYVSRITSAGSSHRSSANLVMQQVAREIRLDSQEFESSCRRSYTKRDMLPLYGGEHFEVNDFSIFTIVVKNSKLVVSSPDYYFVLLASSNYQISTYDRRKRQILIVKHLDRSTAIGYRYRKEKHLQATYFDEQSQEILFCKSFSFVRQQFILQSLQLYTL